MVIPEHQFSFLTDGVPAFTDLAQSVCLVVPAQPWSQSVSYSEKGNILFIKGPDEGGAFRPRLHFWGADTPSTLANHCWRELSAPVGRGTQREVRALLATPLGRALDLSFKPHVFGACRASAGLAVCKYH